MFYRILGHYINNKLNKPHGGEAYTSRKKGNKVNG